MRSLRSLFPGFLACVALLTLAACGGDEEEEQIEYIERPVGLIYNLAYDELNDGSYRLAAAYFNEVERQHPYSIWATKAKLMAAYASYRSLQYDQAINALDRFIQLHPGNRDIAYAFYLKALCYYERISDVRRDQSMTEEALATLQEVVRRFPASAYARDAALKIDLARDHLAGKSMEVGRFYLRRGDTNAAVNRFREVVEEYETTSHVPEALHRLVEAYVTLGLREEAQRTAAVLGYNYPESRWYEDSYALLTRGPGSVGEQQGFFGRAWDSLF